MNKIAVAYIGERGNTKLFDYQEWCRRESANYSGKNAGNGWYSLLLMDILPPNIENLKDDENFQSTLKSAKERRDLLDHSGLSEHFDKIGFSELKKKISDKLEDYPKNIRNHVKDLWTYPKSGKEFEPFQETGILLNDVFKLDEDKFSFTRIEKGCVYAAHNDNKTITDLLWENKEMWIDKLLECGHEFGFDGLEIPPHPSHITVLNSDIGEKHSMVCETLMKKYNEKKFDIQLGEIVHLFDERFAPYETCIVVKVSSKCVDDFIKEFNELTGEHIKISQHITFGVRLRK